MFGLGVRIGYYVQRYALILEESFLKPEKHTIRINLMIFVAATALSVLVQVSNLDPDVVYITLLLTFGYWYHLIVLVGWAVVARFRKDWRRIRNASIFPGHLFAAKYGSRRTVVDFPDRSIGVFGLLLGENDADTE